MLGFRRKDFCQSSNEGNEDSLPFDKVPSLQKGFGLADCDTIFTIYIFLCVHNQLIRTLFEAHVVYNDEISE